MRIAVAGPAGSPEVAALVELLLGAARAQGHEIAGDPAQARLVLNLTTAAAPRAHWRRESLAQFAVSLLPAMDAGPWSDAAFLRHAYPVLLRTLSNAAVAVAGSGCVLVTPELGVRALAAGEVLGALLPLAASTFAIENDVAEDLPEELLDSEVVARLRDGGRRLAGLGLLPSVVRLQDILSAEDLKLLRAVFGLQQISYGNLSAREPSGGFWMTGRGVDKGRLEIVGRDVLLIRGHDEGTGRLRVSVPPGCGDARASVDALEHALLYDAHPGIGAIVHAHAWIDGIVSTRQSWPCGTVELAREVRDLVAAAPDPASAEIGLRNHGVTLTGPSLAAIFERVEGRLRREVPAA